MGLELRHLRFVVSVTEHGSLRRTAAVLGLRQSTLSRAIRELEDRLGVIIFSRSPTGMRPTQAGARLVATAKPLLNEFESLVSTAKLSGIGHAGCLSIGLLSSFAMAPLRPVLLSCLGERRGVDIRLVAKPRAALLLELDAGNLDVAIVTGHPVMRGCETLPLWSERVLIALPHSHALQSRNFVYWTDLRDETFILSRCGVGPDLAAILNGKLATIGSPPKIEEHAVSTEALLSLVVAGRGIVLQTEGSIRGKYDDLIHLEVHDGPGPSWVSYSACWKIENANSAFGLFLAALRAHRFLLLPERVPDT